MDIQKSLETRRKLKAKKPDFVKQEIHKKPKLSSAYRRPRGLQSKMRLQKKGYRLTPSQGYRSPVAVRNMSRNGYLPFVVSTITELEKINPETESIIISSTLGTRKKVELVKVASDKKIFIENIKDATKYLSDVETLRKTEKSSKEKKLSERLAKKDKKTKEAEKKESKKESNNKSDGLENKMTEEDKKELEKKENEKVLLKKQ